MPKNASLQFGDLAKHLRAHPRDAKYLFSWPLLLATLGAAGLAVIGVEEIRSQAKQWVPAPLWKFGSENAILIVVALALLTILPVASDRLVSRIQLRNRELKKNTELSTAAATFSQRTAHLITKTQDSIKGERDSRYIQHTMIDCCKYFKQRAIQINGIDPDSQVDAVLFEAISGSGGKVARLERRKQTHQTAADFAAMITRHRNSQAGELIDGLVVDRNPVLSSTDAEVKSLLAAMKMEETKYCEFLIVPVLKDRKIVGQEGVFGALMLMADQERTFRGTDPEILSAFAWYCSAALSVDHVTKAAV